MAFLSFWKIPLTYFSNIFKGNENSQQQKYEEKFYWFFILSICHLGGKGHQKSAAQMIRLKKVTSR